MKARTKKAIIATMIRARRPDLANAVAKVVTASPAEDFAKAIEKTIKKHFPRSGVISRYSEGIARSITVWFTLQGDPSKFENGISHNDPAHQLIHIRFGDGRSRDLSEQTDDIPEKFTAVNDMASLAVQPDPGSHLAFGRVKLPWRKKTGNQATILKHIDTYFSRVKKIVKDNFDRLPENFKEKAGGLGLN